MKTSPTISSVLEEIESVSTDIFQLTSRLSSGNLTQAQIDVNSRFLLSAIARRQELNAGLKVRHGVHITIINRQQDIQRTAV